jgi:hypothetical protein
MAMLAMTGHGQDARAKFLRPQSFALRNPRPPSNPFQSKLIHGRSLLI